MKRKIALLSIAFVFSLCAIYLFDFSFKTAMGVIVMDMVIFTVRLAMTPPAPEKSTG